jgi:uncharacterized membrane protein
MKSFGKNIIGGIATIIPLWVTWLVVEFVFRKLLMIGAPIIDAIHRAFSHLMPELSNRVSWPLADKIFAVILTVMIFYTVGWAAQRVFGRRLIDAFEAVLGRVPLVKTIYGGVRKLIGTLEGQSTGGQHVVLISFPSEEMKTVGILTRVMTEESTGRTLAIVYVPTTPNPTSGYVEIVPIERVVTIDWTMDEAMSFIMSAGAVAPGRSVKYTADLRPASSSVHLAGTATIGS